MSPITVTPIPYISFVKSGVFCRDLGHIDPQIAKLLGKI